MLCPPYERGGGPFNRTCGDTYCAANGAMQEDYTISVCSYVYHTNERDVETPLTACLTPMKEACKYTCKQLINEGRLLSLDIIGGIEGPNRSTELFPFTQRDIHVGCVPGNQSIIVPDHQFSLSLSNGSSSNTPPVSAGNDLYPSFILSLLLMMVLLVKART